MTTETKDTVQQEQAPAPDLGATLDGFAGSIAATLGEPLQKVKAAKRKLIEGHAPKLLEEHQTFEDTHGNELCRLSQALANPALSSVPALRQRLDQARQTVASVLALLEDIPSRLYKAEDILRFLTLEDIKTTRKAEGIDAHLAAARANADSLAKAMESVHWYVGRVTEMLQQHPEVVTTIPYTMSAPEKPLPTKAKTQAALVETHR